MPPRRCAWRADWINTRAGDFGPAEADCCGASACRASPGNCNDGWARDCWREFSGDFTAGWGAPAARRRGWLSCGGRRRAAQPHPTVTLIGKGVCFDSGGLDIKPGAGMALMKKDMGGAAVALGLAHLAMSAKIRAQAAGVGAGSRECDQRQCLSSRRCARNTQGSDGRSRQHGCRGSAGAVRRLGVCRCERHDLIIDFATLTGAARVALGPELPALFGNDEGVVHELARIAAAEHDPLWPMPLWAGYEDELASKIADLNNVAPSAFAGAIFGALFLKRFVTESAWVHIDLYAWNSKDRPGRGVGAEAQALRGTYRYLVRTATDCVNFSMPKKSPAIDTRPPTHAWWWTG